MNTITKLFSLLALCCVLFTFGCDGACVEGDCACTDSDDCNFECPDGNCNQQCGGDSSCEASCAGGDCQQQCDANASCDFTCEGGGCQQVCNSSDCTASCGDTTCVGGSFEF